MVRYEIHPRNPQYRFLEIVCDILKNQNGICIYPTDTVYGMGACAANPKALDRISTLKQRDKKRFFSFICCDFSQASDYVKISNVHYKLMKRYLPGPYTFILPATNIVPKKLFQKRKTIGIRIPDNIVCIELVKMLGVPLANTSLDLPGQFRGDPEYFEQSLVLQNVDVILECGILNEPIGSTIVDLTGEEPQVIRNGKGIWDG